MPGWYIHLDVARKAIHELKTNAAANASAAGPGPSLEQLAGIADGNPAYFALGAIGPDIFFLLPDFQPTVVGRMIWGAAHLIKNVYDQLDQYLGPYTDEFTAISHNSDDLLNEATGGLSSQLASTAHEFINAILEAAEIVAASEYDIFGWFGSGVQKGYDEKVFFFSDMLHYRKTYQFAAQLWKLAGENTRFQAFALGWMTHLATDVTGHSFVNEKCGGPYRIHWQRHHLVENHMDGEVYVSEYGSQNNYQEISTAALHLWVAFDQQIPPRSYINFLAGDQRPGYNPDIDTAGFLSRRSVWDYDSDLPDDLADFVVEALRAVYAPDANSAGVNGPSADHPEILNALDPFHPDGFPNAADLKTTYWWLYHYIKHTTTDYYRFAAPNPPPVFTVNYSNLASSFPAPPGTGAAPTPAGPSSPPAGSSSTPGGSSSPSLLHLFELWWAIKAWLIYLAQVVAWFLLLIPAMVLSLETWPLRELIYEFVQLPLYNAEMALHFYLAALGYTHPFKSEISSPLTTLGKGWADVFQVIEAALNDPLGGLLAVPTAGTEPSGSDVDSGYPHDVVTDPPAVASIASLGLIPPHGVCADGEAPSEFLRPWRWPDTDLENDAIPSEKPLTRASPYVSSQDAMTLLTSTPGAVFPARSAFEAANSEQDTLTAISNFLPLGEHLGSPADYSGYLMAWLTRAAVNQDAASLQALPNFNLDADRGYGYKCWDWKRSSYIGVPKPFATLPDKRVYQAPLRPGFGWCADELDPSQPLPPVGDPQRPTVHHPESNTSDPVRIRYIDKEPK